MIKSVLCKHGNFIINTNDTYIGKSMELYGEYSEFELQLMLTMIGPGMVAIDGGANIGCFTIPLAQKIGPTGLVVAFDAQTMIYNQLCGNIAINNLYNIRAFNNAIGKENSIVNVPLLNYETENNFGGAQIGSSYNGKQYPITQVMLDDLELHRCDLIKLDIQGCELDALKGGNKLITKFRPLMYIENDSREKSKELIEHLWLIDYDLYWHRPLMFNENNFNNIRENVFENIASFNMICYPKEYNISMSKITKIESSDESPFNG